MCLDAENIRSFVKQGKTKLVKLSTPIPVDLRYETIVAENGSLNIYRDVYERGTNCVVLKKVYTYVDWSCVKFTLYISPAIGLQFTKDKE